MRSKAAPSRTPAVRKLAAVASALFVAVFVAAAVAAVAINGDAAPTYGPVAPGGGAAQPTPGKAASVDDEIASRPMPQFPVAAAQPHQLSTTANGDPLLIPTATATTGAVPTGFPRSAEGALAQLKALNETGMTGMDPTTYAAAYTAIAAPGAPDPATTTLSKIATGSRLKGGLPATGPVPSLNASYQVSAGLTKGSSEDGSFVVPCTLGILSVVTTTSSVRVGIGDCQAMRWSDGRWQISASAQPVLAPATWPGTVEAQRAGYVAVIPYA